MRRTIPDKDPDSDPKLSKRLTLNSTILPESGILNHSTVPSSPKFIPGPFWNDLCKEAATARDLQEFTWRGDELLGSELVLALAAAKTRNEPLLRSLERQKSVERFLDNDTGKVAVDALAVECLRITILAGLEDFACGILELTAGPIPLFLVHRAGEHGLTRFLTLLFRYNTAIRTNRVIATLPLKVKNLLHRRQETKFQRFPGKNRYISKEEILRWAVLSGGREGVKSVLETGLYFDADTIVKVLLSEELPDFITEIVSDRDLAKVSVECLLQYGHLRLAIKVLEVSDRQEQRLMFTRKTPESLRSYTMIAKLISTISDPKSSLSALYLLSMVRKPEWNQPEVELAYETLTRILISEDVEKIIISNHCNPLLLCVAMSELSETVSEYSLQLRDRFRQLSSSFLHLAEAIQSQYTDYYRLKVLYLEKTYGSQCLFDVITANTEKYRVLLKSDTVAALVKDLWTGGDSAGFNFDFMSAANCYLDSHTCDLFAVHKQFVGVTYPKCVFQLHSWVANGSLRFAIETLMVLVLYGILFMQLILFCSVIPILDDPMSHMSEVPDAKETVIVQLKLNAVMTANTAALVLNVVQQKAYKIFQKEPVFFGFADVIPCLLFMCTFVVTYCSTDEMMNTIPLATNIGFQEPLYACLIFSLSVRISSVLMQTRTFGPWIRMIFIIVKDIFVFLILYLLAVLSFATTFVFLFHRDTTYFGTVQISVRTLFQWSVGGIDSSIFTYREELGSVLAIVWGFVSTIILLNLLIAVLSSRFEELAPQVTADYVSILYHSYSQTHYKPPFGALIVSPAPFNVLTFPLLPVYIVFPKVAKHLDRYFVLVSYQGFFALGFLLFFIYNVVLSIFAYFYTIAKLRKCANPGIGRSLAWVVAGPFYLLYLLYVSSVRFAKEMYRETEEPPAMLTLDVFIPSKRFLSNVCKRSPDAVIVPLSDIETSLAKFPYLKQKSTAQAVASPAHRDSQPFRQVAERIYFSKSQLVHSRSRGILEFFGQFRSYSRDEDSAMINLTRMHFFANVYQDNPEKLAAINVFFVQKALCKLRSEKEDTGGD